MLLNNQMRIYAFILSLVHNYEDADDLMQETANTMWQKYPDCQPIKDFLSWGIYDLPPFIVPLTIGISSVK